MKKIALSVSFLTVSFVLSGTAGAQSPQPSQSPQSAREYRVGPRDLLYIKVYEDDRLSGERRVTEDGTVNVPLVGDLQVRGKTTLEIGQQLKQLLEEKYMQRASVDVEIREFRSRPISVIGAVKQPGNLAFSGRWTLLEALTAAGGLVENHGSILYVMRRSDNGLADQIAIDVHDLLVRADPRSNIPIFANDLINVPAVVEVTVYCLGEVAKPGALAFKSSERITLLAAIAHAGGLTDRAASRILIKSADSAGSAAREVTVDYKKILAGKEPDVELRQGDVVVVKESFF